MHLTRDIHTQNKLNFVWLVDYNFGGDTTFYLMKDEKKKCFREPENFCSRRRHGHHSYPITLDKGLCCKGS